MKILVTGANGYLGQGVVKALLDNGHSVVAADFKTNYVNTTNSKDKKYLDVSFLKVRLYFIDGVCTLHLSSRKRKPTTLTRTGRVANTKLIVELFFVQLFERTIC